LRHIGRQWQTTRLEWIVRNKNSRLYVDGIAREHTLVLGVAVVAVEAAFQLPAAPASRRPMPRQLHSWPASWPVFPGARSFRAVQLAAARMLATQDFDHEQASKV
jgi:hypothetical protein